MKNVKNKILELSEEEAMILCYDEEEYREKVRRAVTRTEIKEASEKAIKEGMEKGIAEGKTEEKQGIAGNLLKNGVADEIIMNSTGLSIEELNKLK